MIGLDMVRSIFEHNEWANNRVIEAATLVSEEDLDSPFGETSLKAILLHILASHVSWLAMWTGEMPPLARVEPGQVMAAIRDSYDTAHSRLRAYVDTLTYDSLIAVSELLNPDASGYWRTWKRPKWEVMISTGTHAMQHRGEAALILTSLGQSPGEIDYSYWSWRTKSD